MDTVRYHLAKYGFVHGYYNWYRHGEPIVTNNVDHYVHVNEVGDVGWVDAQSYSAYHNMVMDVAGPSFNSTEMEEEPNPVAKKLYAML